MFLLIVNLAIVLPILIVLGLIWVEKNPRFNNFRKRIGWK